MADSKRGSRSPRGTPRDRLRALDSMRRGRLLDPAEDEFAAHGFDAASLNRILVAAAMSKGQAYYYIADKADLYDAVMERAFGRLLTRMDVRADTPTDAAEFWGRVGDLVSGLTSVFASDDRLATLARGIYEGRSAGAALAGQLDRLRTYLTEIVSTGQLLGAVREDLPQSLIADTVFAALREIDRWFAANWDELPTDEALRVGARSVDMIRAMSAPPLVTPDDVPTGNDPQ